MQMQGRQGTLLRAERLLDGSGADPIEEAALLIENARVVAMGRRREIRPPAGLEIAEIEYGGATILPGLVDAHTHLIAPGDGTWGDELAQDGDDIMLMRAAKNARAALHAGVTTLRDNGAKNRVTFSLRDCISRGLTAGPRLNICGRPITITGGHMWYFGSEADGPDAVRREVRKLVKESADYIKIVATGGSTRSSFPNLPSYTVEELNAITDEARKFGKLTAAHCASSQGIANCLEAGVDMIIHCQFREADGRYMFREDLAERIVKSNAWVNPTLYTMQATVVKLEEKQNRQEKLTEAEERQLDERKRRLEEHCEGMRRLLEMGAKLIAGSDSPWADYAPGGFVHEIQTMTEAGMSNMEAIVAGTSAAAESIGLGDIAGYLKPGCYADVLVVDGNPIEDPGRSGTYVMFSAAAGALGTGCTARRIDTKTPHSYTHMLISTTTDKRKAGGE